MLEEPYRTFGFWAKSLVLLHSRITVQRMAKKYQVFISSTFDDLKEHRDAVMKAVLQLGHLPVDMKMFNAFGAGCRLFAGCPLRRC